MKQNESEKNSISSLELEISKKLENALEFHIFNAPSGSDNTPKKGMIAPILITSNIDEITTIANDIKNWTLRDALRCGQSLGQNCNTLDLLNSIDAFSTNKCKQTHPNYPNLKKVFD